MCDAVTARWAPALKIIDFMIAVFNRLKQDHNIHQMILSKIIIILYGGDLETARRLFNSSVGYAAVRVHPRLPFLCVTGVLMSVVANV